MEGHSINGTDAPGGAAAAAAAAAAAPVSSGSSFSFLNDDDFFDSAVAPEPVQQQPPPQPPAQQSHHSTSDNEQPPQWQQQPVQHNSPQQWQQQQQQQQYPSPQQSPGAESFVSRSPPPQSYSEPRSAAPTSTASPHSHSHLHALSPAHAAPALAPHAGPLLEMPWPESPAASPGAAQRHSPGVPAAATAAPLPSYSPFPVLDQQPGSGGTPGGAYLAVQQQQQPSQQQQQQHHSVPLDADGWQQWPAAIAAGPVSGSAPAPRPVSPVAPSVPFRSQPPPLSPIVAALPPHNPYAERPASAQQQPQQQRPQTYQQQPQQQQPQQLFQQSPASQSPMMQQQPLSHSPSQGAFPGPGHSRNQSGSVPPRSQLQQQSPSPNVPVGLPVQPGSAEIICPYCTVRLRFPIGAELVRCGSCNSISRLPPQMQTSPPQPQQVGQQQLAPQSGAAPLPLQPGMQPLPQPMMASQAPATRVRFQCSGCAQWLATDVGPDGSAVARCPSCQTLMRPMMTLAPPPPQQLTPAQLQAFQQQQRQSMPLQQQQQQLQQQQMLQQRPQQQLSGAQMQYPGNAHLLANPAMLASQQQQQQQAPQQLTVLQQQEYLLAQAAANKAARERQQQQGQAQPSSYAQGPPLPTQRVLSAGASFVGSAQTMADPRYQQQQQQQLQRPQSVRRPSGDYSGIGSASFAHSNSGPQQQRFAPAPRPSPSLQPSLSDDFVDAPYTPMNGAPSMAAGGGLGSQMAALHHAHNAAPPMPFSARSHSQSRPQWSEGKEESEAQVAADAEFARQMAERLNALDVSGRVDSEGAPIDQAGRSQAVRRVRATAGDDKALPLLANPL